VQKFAVGVPSWRQVNINGFGDQNISSANSLAAFDGSLYAGIYQYDEGGQIWRQNAAGDWTVVVTGGFGDAYNRGVFSLAEFNGYLYAGTVNDVSGDESVSDGGEIWRSATGDAGDWEQVVDGGFGDSDNVYVFQLAALGDYLYASTVNYGSGAEIWRSATGASGSWEQVMEGGFGNSLNWYLRSLVEFDGRYYAGTSEGEVWHSETGTLNTWKAADAPVDGWRAYLEPFDGYLYMTLNFMLGEDQPVYATIWRTDHCDENTCNWTLLTDQFQDDGSYNGSLEAFGGELYAFVRNDETGMQTWKTSDGSDWTALNLDGFGDSNNVALSMNGQAVFDNRLYLGVNNNINGAEIWVTDFSTSIYLPYIKR
jgi:hypothetical protein